MEFESNRPKSIIRNSRKKFSKNLNQSILSNSTFNSANLLQVFTSKTDRTFYKDSSFANNVSFRDRHLDEVSLFEDIIADFGLEKILEDNSKQLKVDAVNEFDDICEFIENFN